MAAKNEFEKKIKLMNNSVFERARKILGTINT